MKSNWIGQSLAVLLLAGSCAAAVPAEKPRDKTVRLAQSRVEAIDREHMTLTVKPASKGENLVLRITSATRFWKGKNYGTSRDLVVGDSVTGSIRKKSDGKNEALKISVQSTAKSAAKSAPKPAAKPVKKPATKPAKDPQKPEKPSDAK